MKYIQSETDILIVGAGVSGLYVAWRLLKDDSEKKVTIIERLNRAGGCLNTDLIKINDGTDEAIVVRDEEGGMRFTYQMEELMSLFNGLKLCDQIVDFPMTTNRFFVRGCSFTVDEAAANNNAIWGELYNLTPAKQNQSPSIILNTIYNRILRANGVDVAPENPTPEFWQKFRLEFKWKGITMNKWQMGGLFSDMGYTKECIKMMVDTVGFQAPFLSTVSAGEAWQILEDFPKNPHYHTFKDGFSTLIKALQKEVEFLGGEITVVDSLVGELVEDAYDGDFSQKHRKKQRTKNRKKI